MEHEGALDDVVPEERQLALLVSGAVDYAIFMLDLEGRITSWNAGAERLKGWRREEVLGRSFELFHTPEDLERGHPAEELVMARHHGRYEEEGWRVRKDGSRFWTNVVISLVRDERGRPIGFGKVSRDLTARRLAEEQTSARAAELEEANARLSEFRRLVTSVRDYAIFMLDPGGHILSWNAGAQHLKGYTEEEAVGRHFSVFYTEEDRLREHPLHELQLAARDGRYEEEGWRVRRDGTRFWASVTLTAIRDDEGRLTGYAKVTRNLTARKAAEDALQEAVVELQAANEELDRFASVVAHDLMDPLSTIKGFADVLAHRDVPPAQAREFAQHIHGSSERLGRMVHGLLDFARAGGAPAAREPVELAGVVAAVHADLAAPIARREAEVALAVPEDAVVLAAGGDVRLLVQNLIANAVKFGAPEGPRVAVSAERQGPAWRVVVEDDGSGIAPADQARIFQPFERAAGDGSQSGHGLGLAICQRLVERHGGAIGVTGRPGGGSRFWVTLPAAD